MRNMPRVRNVGVVVILCLAVLFSSKACQPVAESVRPEDVVVPPCSVDAALSQIPRFLREDDMLVANKILKDWAKADCELIDHHRLRESLYFIRTWAPDESRLQYRFTDGRINIGIGVHNEGNIVLRELTFAMRRKTDGDREW